MYYSYLFKNVKARLFKLNVHVYNMVSASISIYIVYLGNVILLPGTLNSGMHACVNSLEHNNIIATIILYINNR